MPAEPPLSTDDLVQRLRDLLNDTPAVRTSTTPTTATSIDVDDPTDISQGSILEWQTGDVGYEQMLVATDPAGANPITVVRGYNGTTAETHTSGDRLFVDPAFTGRKAQQALRQAVRMLWPYVYRVEDIDVTPVANQYWYDVTAPDDDTLGIVSVTQRDGTTPSYTVRRYVAEGSGKRGYPVRFDPETNTDVVPSGQGLYIPTAYNYTEAIIVKVQEVVTGDNDIEDNSLFPVADCVVNLAAGSLVGGGEIARVSSGADLETSGSVSTGSRLNTGLTYTGLGQAALRSLALAYRNYYRPIWPGR